LIVYKKRIFLTPHHISVPESFMQSLRATLATLIKQSTPITFLEQEMRVP